MTLKHLVVSAGLLPAEMAGDAEITGIEIDSRKIAAGGLFVAMPDTTRPSEAFIPAAAQAGAAAALVYSKEGMELAVAHGLAVVLIPHRELRFSEAVWQLCDTFFEHPSRALKLLGITGTNGKTTTAWVARDILSHLGFKAGYMGTLGLHLPGQSVELENTTPFAVDLYNAIALARSQGVDALAMEVSSHALHQRRVGGLEFDVALLTNLTQDHLDYHGTMERYAAAKHQLFTQTPPGTSKSLVGAFNLDDPTAAKWAVEQNGPTVTYSQNDPEADLIATPIEVGVDRITMELRSGTRHQVQVPLGGNYNVENTLAAVAAVMALGIPLSEICPILHLVRPVPGRFETVPNDRGISVLVDYAHTPDALEKLLSSVREVSAGRLITVFGCGGDRDRTKRPKMASAASAASDLTVVTSDNPRTEDPQAILDEVMGGIVPGRECVAILERPEAVAYAIASARAGDVVVIAGKGHENYQIVGRTKLHMDDRELALHSFGAPRK